MHRQELGTGAVTRVDGIPVTSIGLTIVNLATRLDDAELERAISEAVYLDHITLDGLLSVLDEGPRRPGAGRLRALITRYTFRLTDSELERIFIPIAVRAGLPVPETRVYVTGHRVDFWWPQLGLVVETDGGRPHRSPARQTADRRRDQDHLVAGLTPLRFTHWQVAHERRHVGRVLQRVASQLTLFGRFSGGFGCV